MKAMVLKAAKQLLQLEELPIPSISDHEILVKVKTCGVCRTDLHLADGDLTPPKYPVIPGHQVVGIIEKAGKNAKRFPVGERIGLPWLSFICGKCEFCLSNLENLCDNARFMGFSQNGGYAEYCVADPAYAFLLPQKYSDEDCAPFLCAGLIGYRALRLVGNVNNYGLFGFGSSAHLLLQILVARGKKVFVFTRPNDHEGQEVAIKLGAFWAGGSTTEAPELLESSIIFAPVGELYLTALKMTKKGGTVISAGIHMTDLPPIPYRYLWEERSIKSVANLTRKDGEEFFKEIASIHIKPTITMYRLEDANKALDDIRSGALKGSAVLKISD